MTRRMQFSRSSQLRLWPFGRTGLHAFLLTAAVLMTHPTEAQIFTVVYAFSGPDGANPRAGVILDARGTLYGTTEAGGAFGYGTVFKLETTGKETVLHSFTGGDGLWPEAGLLRDQDGTLYGTTTVGGTSEGGQCRFGCGTVFKLDRTGKETVLYAFTGGKDGRGPAASLVRDAAGNLYGTTQEGGSGGAGWGTVFKVDITGKETVLHTFTGGADGGNPWAGLVRDLSGNLYSTTFAGGIPPSYDGTVFEISKTGKETILYSFAGADGSSPEAGVVRDREGNLYGTTTMGGTSNVGTVFKLDKNGNETVLHTFTARLDGGYPWAGVVRDAAGNLYGTTNVGGLYDRGVIFRVDPTGIETVLYSFSGETDGSYPSGLTLDATGALYGTAQGGSRKSGLIFKLIP